MQPSSMVLSLDEIGTFTGTFTMPNWGLLLNVDCYYWIEGYWGDEDETIWIDGYWVKCDTKSIEIKVDRTPPVLEIHSPSGSVRAYTVVQDYASVGESVPVSVFVENLADVYVYAGVSIGISYEGELYNIYNPEPVAPGEVKEVLFSLFTMPDVIPTSDRPNRFVQIAEFTYIYDAVWNGNSWNTSNDRVDFMAMGHQVRVMPSTPQFNIAMKNYPADAFVWLIQYKRAEVWAQSGILNVGTTWYSPSLAPDAVTAFEVYVWDKTGTRLHYYHGSGAIFSGKSYEYDYITGILSEAEEPGPSEITVSLSPGESKLVTFQVIPNKVGVYQVAVDGLNGTFEAQ